MAKEVNTFYIQVIATNKVFFAGRARCVTVTTHDGGMQFLAHHEPMIVCVEPGELDIEPETGETISVVAGLGTMVFANNRATLLVETCETQEELDERRATEALERAKERLRQKQSLVEYNMTQAAMARALSRIKFKEKHI